jgi:light-regulated signal transduction histidine kinase (bacteriophytochrome)
LHEILCNNSVVCLIVPISNLLENRYDPQDCATLPELKIVFAGKEFSISSSRHQVLDLLLSTYETAIFKNRELISAKEELNELNKRMKAANHDLEAFSSTVSHDLRKPLNNIYIACQAIERRYKDSLDQGCRDYFKYIYNAAESMNGLISSLLEFSAFSNREINRDQVDLTVMAMDILEESRYSEPNRRVTFHVAEGVSGNGDLMLMRVVMGNMLGNAWKYTLMKETALIEFGVKEINGSSTYFVRDNGAGFEMAKADDLFTPFQRLHSEKEFEGFGIGLSTVQRILERHGGRVWAEGEVGKGAIFYFTLNT